MAAATADIEVRAGENRTFKVIRYLATPILLGLIVVGLYAWLSSQELDSIEERALRMEVILERLGQHIELTLLSTAFVGAIAIPLGIVLTRPATRRLTPYALAVANTGQAIPSIGLLALLAAILDIGFTTAVLALVAYTTLPVLRNTMVGLERVNPALIEAGRGMGMSKAMVLFRVELPLAVPVMVAGIRTALIINVGTATLATFIGAGGLGALIDEGISLGRDPVLITGALLTAVLALTIDWLAGAAEDVVRPRGL
jgi:osmoprotectant transport system permease protein